MTIDINSLISDLNELPLSDLLDQLEVDLSHLGQGDPSRAEKMLIRMDVVGKKISSLVESQIPVTAENAQFEYIQHSLEKNCRSLLSDFGGANRLAEIRDKVRPTENQPWWFIERCIERQKKKTLRSIGASFGIIALIFLIISILFNTILKPDPIVVARYTHEVNAEQYLAQNDPTRALVEIDAALALGEDAGLSILRGVIETQLGQNVEALADFVIAESIIGNRNDFLLTRTESWLRVGQLEKAMKDIREVMQTDAESVQAYFYYGKVLELESDYSGAVNAYQKASELAEKQGKAELNATIRMSMAMLMQSIPLDGSVTRTPTP